MRNLRRRSRGRRSRSQMTLRRKDLSILTASSVRSSTKESEKKLETWSHGDRACLQRVSPQHGVVPEQALTNCSQNKEKQKTKPSLLLSKNVTVCMIHC